MNVKQFAKIFSEELEKEFWGTIDPVLFKMIADGTYKDDEYEQSEDATALRELLKRVFKRMETQSNVRRK